MQKISSMQRSRSNIYVIANAIIFILLLIYLVTTSVYRNLPPLIGIFFLYVLILKFEEDNKFKNMNFTWYFAIFYLFIAEQIHGFKLFSILISYIIFYFLLLDISLKIVKFRNLLIIAYVCFGYIIPFLVSNFIAYIQKDEFMDFTTDYVLYIFIETIASIVLFKGKFV